MKMFWIGIAVAVPLWIIATTLVCLTDFGKMAFRMVDVDRASVYSKHLGSNMKGMNYGAGAESR